ncbi:MAG: CBS domain-containing protein [Anaerolineaceae bacterium]|mgnify:CR=1 FL=1|jgi:CBS domain-containing protein|nr:CBS domain-containing protein [Anaerolineaceae bacterium]
MLKVKELINLKGGEIYYVSPHTSMRAAIDLLVEKKVGALPVLDETGLVGIISERDMIRFLAEESEAILEMPVSTFMTRNVVTVPAETPLEECMQIMINRNFRHLLVRENDKFVGIISMRDMVSTLLKDRDILIQDLEKYITGTR